MGNNLNCSCLETIALPGTDNEKSKQDRLSKLRMGNKFMKSALLGLTSQELQLNLNENGNAINWKTTEGAWQCSFGQIDLMKKKKKK